MKDLFTALREADLEGAKELLCAGAGINQMGATEEKTKLDE